MSWIEDSLWRTIHASMPIVCVDIAAIHKGCVALLKRSVKPEAGKWWFPGGRLYKGERPEDAVLRILLQEAGLRAVPQEIRFASWHNAIYPESPFDDEMTHTLNLIYSTPVTDIAGEPVIRPNADHEAGIWWDGDPGSLSGVGEPIIPIARHLLGLPPLANVQDEIEKTVLRRVDEQ